MHKRTSSFSLSSAPFNLFVSYEQLDHFYKNAVFFINLAYIFLFIFSFSYKNVANLLRKLYNSNQ